MATLTNSIKAADVMTRLPVSVTPQTTIRELARTLEENGISGTPVVDPEGRLVGVVSRTDLLRCCVQGDPALPVGYLFEQLSDELGNESDLLDKPAPIVEEFMTDEPVTARPDEPVAVIARRMAQRRVHRTVIVDERQRPIGIVTTLDLLRVFPD